MAGEIKNVTIDKNNPSVVKASGIFSKANLNAILESVQASEDAKVKAIQDKIDIKNQQISALQTLKSTINALQDSARYLRKDPGLFGLDNNAFDSKNAVLSSSYSGIADASKFVGISAANNSKPVSFDIAIKQTALAGTQASGNVITSDTNALGIGSGSGTDYEIGLENGLKATIKIKTTDSLNNIASKINTVTGTSGVFASVIKVSDNDFKLQLYSNKTGASNDIDTSLSFFSNSGLSDPQTILNFSTGVVARDAIFKIDNSLELTRDSNVITDVYSGITINLTQATPNYSAPDPDRVRVSFTPDVDNITTKVKDFVTNYNSYRLFYAEQNVRKSDGNFDAEKALLGGNSLLNSFEFQINGTIRFASSIDGVGLGIGSVGIESKKTESDLNEDGLPDPILNLIQLLPDGEKIFRDEVTKNIGAVRAIFENTYITSDPNLVNTSRSSNTSLNEFTLQFKDPFTSNNVNLTNVARTSATSLDSFSLVLTDDGSGNYGATAIPNGGAASFPLNITKSGATYTITGTAGSTLEGAVYKFNGSAVPAVSINVEQGGFLDGVAIIPKNGIQTYQANISKSLDINGNVSYRIVGKEGTPLEGAVYTYRGEVDTTNTSIVIKQEQGLAEQIYNFSQSYAKISGLIDEEIARIQDSINGVDADNLTRAQEQRDRVVATQSEKLALLDQAQSNAQSSINAINAIFGNNNNSNSST
jgi:flagellar hook-associated protein 2